MAFALDALLDPDGRVVADPSRSGPLYGEFDDPDALWRAASSARQTSVYVAPNPVRLSDPGADRNRLRRPAGGEKVAAGRFATVSFVCVNFNIKRIAMGLSSTDAEHAAAMAVLGRFRREHPDAASAALWGSSGDGAYAVVRVRGLPNGRASRRLVAGFLDVLAAMYGRPGRDTVLVDTARHRPHAYVPVPGTVRRKGCHCDHRPHRLVTVEGGGRPCEGLDLAGWLARHGATRPWIRWWL
jgi:hypothetical protein